MLIGYSMKWIYLFGLVCSIFICFFWTALMIYGIVIHDQRWWIFLVILAPFARLTQLMFRWYKQEQSDGDSI